LKILFFQGVAKNGRFIVNKKTPPALFFYLIFYVQFSNRTLLGQSPALSG